MAYKQTFALPAVPHTYLTAQNATKTRCGLYLDDLKDRRGYCQLKEEALDRTVWRNRSARGSGPVVLQITDDELLYNKKGYNLKMANLEAETCSC